MNPSCVIHKPFLHVNRTPSNGVHMEDGSTRKWDQHMTSFFYENLKDSNNWVE